MAAAICLGFLSNTSTWADSPAIADTVDNFKLPLVGEEGELDLMEELKSGPVVVVMLRGYPGYQCPLCSRQVASFANRAKAFAKVTDRVILVYPGPADMLTQHAKEFMGQRRLPEPMKMVRDADMQLVSSWGLRWDAPNETAYPAAFVINQDGTVAWKKISNNHGGRATAEEVIKGLRKLPRAN